MVSVHGCVWLGTAVWEERRKGRERAVVSLPAFAMVLEGSWEGVWGDPFPLMHQYHRPLACIKDQKSVFYPASFTIFAL